MLIRKINTNETKAWFKSSFVPSSQETDRPYSTAAHGLAERQSEMSDISGDSTSPTS